jgi:transcription elongation factor
MSSFPHPREWNFEEGEQVFVCSANMHGSITSVGPEILEVDFGASGLMAVPWYDVRKAIKVGDFVTIMSGSLHGVTGWVVKVDEDNVHIIEKQVESNTSADPSCSIKVFIKPYHSNHSYTC